MVARSVAQTCSDLFSGLPIVVQTGEVHVSGDAGILLNRLLDDRVGRTVIAGPNHLRI